uniref:Uncharacterized protein n=1 Tax=Octopus bimaculoides TaxID=37653 RepID=A0A0L8G294_OCTBM
MCVSVRSCAFAFPFETAYCVLCTEQCSVLTCCSFKGLATSCLLSTLVLIIVFDWSG